jgi:cystathionine gamma-lyase
MHRDTNILHAGHGDPKAPGLIMPGPQFSSTYITPGNADAHALQYGRDQNPTWSAWEQALGVLEQGESVAFASGMAAMAALFGVALKPGDTVVLPADSYYKTRVVASGWLQSLGIKLRLGATAGSEQQGMLDGAKLVLLETPSNPLLDVCDIAAVVAAARRTGTLVAVDNTTATGYLQRPLALGADFVVASDTKSVTGHSDLLVGHVAARDAAHVAALRAWRTQQGAIPGPMEVWLAHRSLATLPLRLTRQCQTALALAEDLNARGVAVRYPGLPSHAGHAIAKRQMDAFGQVVSFDLETRQRAERWLGKLELVREATSFGGVHSSAERRARWGGDAISEGFIRFSVGCEATDDLIDDVTRAL